MLKSAVEIGHMSAVGTRHLSLLLINIYPPERPTTDFAKQTCPSPPLEGPDLLHRRSDSEPEAWLGAHVGLHWLIPGYLEVILAPSWLQLGNLGLILVLSSAILATNSPSVLDFGSLLRYLKPLLIKEE